MLIRIPLLIALVLSLLMAGCARESQFEVVDTTGLRWFKGNTHTHTTMSDGDSPPEIVARWYKEHGYNFLVLSDHNVFTDPQTLTHLVDSTFLLIPGEELSARFDDKPVHVNGLDIPGVVAPQFDTTLVGTVQKNVDAVRAAGGVPHVNHPNFGWAFHHQTLIQVRNNRLLEIFNGHPLVHNFGGGGWPSAEAIWDHLLTTGQRIYGIAVDDAHHFQGEFAPHRSNPGRGWVAVRARRLDPREIVERLEAGFFYASTGVELQDIVVQPRSLAIHIRPRNDFRFRTEFIGRGGRLLHVSEANPAVFRLRRQRGYVRARVVDSGGFVAWVQPLFVK